MPSRMRCAVLMLLMALVPRAHAAAPAVASARSEAADTLDEVVRRMGTYVAGYGEKASLIVATEKYVQRVQAEDGSTFKPRWLVAEMALVKTSGAVGWVGYRDVIEVDGQQIVDHRDRLLKVLTDASAAGDEATRIANESARFNVGTVSRNFNVPTAALFFFHPTRLSRFTFKQIGTKKIDGVETWEIEFSETKTPTLIMTRAGKDVPCEGTLWVIPADGTVVRTRFSIRGFADDVAMPDLKFPRPPAPTPPPQTIQTTTGPGGTTTTTTAPAVPSSPVSTDPGIPMIPKRLESTADVDVTYRRDDRLGMWVPSKMSEHYEGPIPRPMNAMILGRTSTTATYSDFKRFETSSKISVPR